MSFDARLFPSTAPPTAERRAKLSARALAGVVGWGAFVSVACDSPTEPSSTSSSARDEGHQSSTYKLEPPVPQPLRAPETHLAALAMPREGEKQGEQSASDSVSPACVNGWSAPPRGSALRSAALDMMRSSAGQRFVIDEMRYFVGPEDADVISPQTEVERWYVKGYPEGEFERRRRWLVRRARIGSGVDAVALYESRGYGPKTWTRLDAPDEQLADPFQYPCDPARPEAKCMGLPPQVLGCLDGT